jgi:hypothetical protein
MRFVIDAFPEYRKKIEILYKDNGVFKELCDHYDLCTKTRDSWKESRKKEGPERRIEYEELLRGLEEEIHQYLIE